VSKRVEAHFAPLADWALSMPEELRPYFLDDLRAALTWLEAEVRTEMDIRLTEAR